eukprot:COSAG03_NODE_142_length_11687_cov_11.710131_5_plen_248_part_00
MLHIYIPLSRYVAGLLMAIGWWCLIDAAVYNSCQSSPDNRCNLTAEVFAQCLGGEPQRTPRKLLFAMYLPGIGATLGMVMVNCFNYNAYTEERAKSLNNGWLFVSYLILFCAVAASAWSLVDYWLAEYSCTVWPGLASLVQTICLLLGATIFFVGNGGLSPQAGVGIGDAGMCGGGLFAKWGCVFTAFGLFSSFGCSLELWRTNLIQSSFYSSNLAGLVLCAAVLFEVKEGAITRTSTRHTPLSGGI